MKITTFKTYQLANQRLGNFYYKNAMVTHDIYSQFIGIARNFQKEVVRADKGQMDILAQEFRTALSQLGKREQITAPLKLYHCSLGYGLEVDYLNNEADVMEGYFTSVDALASAVREQRHQSPFSSFGVRETPFLYTVVEPYHFSEEEKKKVREIYQYDLLDHSQKSNLDTVLEAYVESGLGPEERQEFEKIYLKFFN